MITVLCKVCGKEFKTKKWLVEQGWSKCCSRKCRNEAQKKGRFVNCYTCRKRIWKFPSAIKASISKKFFCNKSCQTVWRNKFYSGSRHALWRGGYSSHYRRILLKSDTSIKCKLCNEEDKRILHVHHIDSNRKNNKISNLSWLCVNCHRLVHLYNERI